MKRTVKTTEKYKLFLSKNSFLGTAWKRAVTLGLLLMVMITACQNPFAPVYAPMADVSFTLMLSEGSSRNLMAAADFTGKTLSVQLRRGSTTGEVLRDFSAVITPPSTNGDFQVPVRFNEVPTQTDLVLTGTIKDVDGTWYFAGTSGVFRADWTSTRPVAFSVNRVVFEETAKSLTSFGFLPTLNSSVSALSQPVWGIISEESGQYNIIVQLPEGSVIPDEGLVPTFAHTGDTAALVNGTETTPLTSSVTQISNTLGTHILRIKAQDETTRDYNLQIGIVGQQEPEPEIFTLTFNPNGGEGPMVAIDLNEGEMTTLPSATFIRSGFSFAGWNTQPDGTGTDYADQTSFTMGTTSVTLYAQWLLEGPAFANYDFTFTDGSISGPIPFPFTDRFDVESPIIYESGDWQSYSPNTESPLNDLTLGQAYSFWLRDFDPNDQGQGPIILRIVEDPEGNEVEWGITFEFIEANNRYEYAFYMGGDPHDEHNEPVYITGIPTSEYLNLWNHFLLDFNPAEDQIRWYMNGLLVKTMSLQSKTTHIGSLYVGYPDKSPVFALDDLEIFTGSLTEDKRNALAGNRPTTLPVVTFGTPSPADGATNVDVNLVGLDFQPIPFLDFAWDTQRAFFDYYFGTDPTNMTRFGFNEWTNSPVNVSFSDSIPLEFSTTYYWQVVAKNGAGNVESPVYSFTTEDSAGLNVTINLVQPNAAQIIFEDNISTLSLTGTGYPETMEVTVNGETGWVYHWYLNGNVVPSPGVTVSGVNNNILHIDIDSEGDWYLGVHTITLIVDDGQDVHSNEFVFQVVQ